MKPDDAADAPATLPALTPKQRLEASRARLHAALLVARGQAPAQGRGEAPPGRADSRFGGVLRSGRRIWARHPLRGAVSVLRHVVGPSLAVGLKPVARSYPWRLIAIAATAGALLTWLRPWRLLPHAALGSALFAVLLPRRVLLHELMTSGVFERLAQGDLMSRWFGSTGESAPRHADPAASPSAAASHGPDAAVLHRAASATDVARPR